MAFSPGVHYDKVLTEVSIRYSQDGFIATRVFPQRPVVKESDLIPVYDRENQRKFNALRADGSLAPEVEWGWTLSPYLAQEHALRSIVTDRALQNVDDPIGCTRPSGRVRIETFTWTGDTETVERQLQPSFSTTGY